MDRIKDIIEENHPQIMIINEFNALATCDVKLYNIPGFKLEIDQLYEESGIGCTGMYIADYLIYKRRHDLEKNDISSISIILGFPNRKSSWIKWSNNRYKIYKTTRK